MKLLHGNRFSPLCCCADSCVAVLLLFELVCSLRSSKMFLLHPKSSWFSNTPRLIKMKANVSRDHDWMCPKKTAHKNWWLAPAAHIISSILCSSSKKFLHPNVYYDSSQKRNGMNLHYRSSLYAVCMDIHMLGNSSIFITLVAAETWLFCFSISLKEKIRRSWVNDGAGKNIEHIPLIIISREMNFQKLVLHHHQHTKHLSLEKGLTWQPSHLFHYFYSLLTHLSQRRTYLATFTVLASLFSLLVILSYPLVPVCYSTVPNSNDCVCWWWMMIDGSHRRTWQLLHLFQYVYSLLY